MKKSRSKSQSKSSKNKQCLSAHFNNNNNNNKKGADEDTQLALALSLSILSQVTPTSEDPVIEDVIARELVKRKRVRLDETEVPSLLVTSEQDYSASVVRRAHNLLDVSGHGFPTVSISTNVNTQEYSLWKLSSLSELESDQEFVVDFLRNIHLPVLPIQTPHVSTDPYTLVYNSSLPLLSSVFSNFLLSPFLSDTVLVTKDSYKLPSHLFILAAHSALIRDLISERYNMKRILMRGHEVHTVVPLLEFMYLGKFQFESIHLEMTKKLASILQMDTFLTCLEEHQRIANPIQERDDCSEIQLSQEIANTEAKSPNYLLK